MDEVQIAQSPLTSSVSKDLIVPVQVEDGLYDIIHDIHFVRHFGMARIRRFGIKTNHSWTAWGMGLDMAGYNVLDEDGSLQVYHFKWDNIPHGNRRVEPYAVDTSNGLNHTVLMEEQDYSRGDGNKGIDDRPFRNLFVPHIDSIHDLYQLDSTL